MKQAGVNYIQKFATHKNWIRKYIKLVFFLLKTYVRLSGKIHTLRRSIFIFIHYRVQLEMTKANVFSSPKLLKFEV